jgi:hypothetical protein
MTLEKLLKETLLELENETLHMDQRRMLENSVDRIKRAMAKYEETRATLEKEFKMRMKSKYGVGE